jgi:hypothetical protein
MNDPATRAAVTSRLSDDVDGAAGVQTHSTRQLYRVVGLGHTLHLAANFDTCANHPSRH